VAEWVSAVRGSSHAGDPSSNPRHGGGNGDEDDQLPSPRSVIGQSRSSFVGELGKNKWVRIINKICVWKKAHYTQTYIAVHPAADRIPYKDPRTPIRAHNWHQKRSIMGEITYSSIESGVIQMYRHSDAYYGAGVYFVSMGLYG
jgi:hypothetical protein